MGRRKATPFGPLIDRVESAAGLDPAAKAVANRFRSVVSPGAVKDALSGTWLGHPLHPALTDIVIGSLLSSTLLDLLGGDGDGRAQSRLICVGLAAAGPTALSGTNDWADAEPDSDAVRRSGLVHAASNTGGLSFYTASLAARRRGAHRRGALLGLGGAVMLLASSYLGGHLSFSRGVGPDQTVFDPGPDDWTTAADASQLPEGRPTRIVVDETPVLVLRHGDGIHAIHDRCSHRGCSLSETGEVDGEHIVCGCHGSTFDLRDGSVQRGPTTAPQPAFEVRERDGRIELRRVAT
jgi:nitrite reductase/ring-hydroxylating ferredoxin subunit